MWLQYALDKDNNLVSIHDVKRGKSDIRCPYCQGELTAKKGKVKAHHFAHVKDTCDLSQNRNVSLPFYYGFNLVLTPKQFQYLKTVTSPDYGKIQTRYSYKEERRNERTKVSLVEREILKSFSHKPTLLGQAILKQLSLQKFCEAQEKLSQEKLKQLQNNLVSLDKKIEQTTEFKKSDYYLGKPIRYQRVVNKNHRLDRERLQQALIDLDIYCAQYQRVLHNHLYLLEIKVIDNAFYKIGVTTRDIQERIQEIKNDLSKIFSEFSVSLLGLWLHRGNIEYYFKYLYSEFNYSLCHLTEYFNFPDIEPILKDLNDLGIKKLSELEKDIFDGQAANKFLLSEHIRQGMRLAKYNGTHIGRPLGKTESTKEFLAKPKNKAIASVLKKGLSLRQTAKKTGASINTVRKVKAALENSKS